MNRKRILQLGLVILLLLALLFIGTKREPVSLSVAIYAVNEQSVPQVTLDETVIQKRGDSYELAGKLSNFSDVPVTLVAVRLFCERPEEKEYGLTVAVKDTRIKVKNEETGKRQKITQQVPVEVAMGESVYVEQYIQNFDSEPETCLVEVKNWSKYEE